MTSTVLDVTVFLLCISASVGTLLTGGPAAPGDSPDAQATADRIATVTGTVHFTTADEDGSQERQHRATLSVLLANAVVASPTGEHSDSSSTAGTTPPNGSTERTTYTEAVLALVRERIDPRTRVIARSEERAAGVVVGSTPPRDADVAVAAFSVPVRGESEYVRIVVQRWAHG